MIDLYYWPTPNGWKVSIALEEMGLDYRTHYVDITAGEQFEPEFLKIAPNNRMPAIVDPEGPDGAPVSIFESGAILQYLARKTGRFYGESERDRVAVDQWLMWQMGGVGPMAGQATHFIRYAPAMEPPQDHPYARDRYTAEVDRLYSVLDRQLARHEWVAGEFFSIADMAIWPWAGVYKSQGQTLEGKPNLERWHEAMKARPAVRSGRALGADRIRFVPDDKEALAVLFKR